MILELVGKPGCGKTYLSNEIVRKINKQNKKCFNIVDIQRNNILVKIIWKIIRVFLKFNYIYKKELYYFRTVFEKYRNTESNLIDVDIDYYIEHLVILRYLYKKLNNSHKIYIFDEGILQTLLSMGIYFDIDPELYKKHLNEILPKHIIITYLCATNDIVKESIKKRNRHVCEMDEFDDNELNIFLEKYDEYCKYTVEKTSCLKVYREDKLEKNIDTVISNLI